MVGLPLPAVPFPKLKLILKAYSATKEDADRNTIARLSNIDSSTISKSNNFLVELGIISRGKKKIATDFGRNLNRSIEFNRKSEAKMLWAQAIETSEVFSELLVFVRSRRNVTPEEFIDDILYQSNRSVTSSNKTGARCVYDVFLEAEILTENDGQVFISNNETAAPLGESEMETNTSGKSEELLEKINKPTTNALSREYIHSAPSIAINIQLHLPATDDPAVYNNLFSALKEHLFPDGD